MVAGSAQQRGQRHGFAQVRAGMVGRCVAHARRRRLRAAARRQGPALLVCTACLESGQGIMLQATSRMVTHAQLQGQCAYLRQACRPLEVLFSTQRAAATSLLSKGDSTQSSSRLTTMNFHSPCLCQARRWQTASCEAARRVLA
jgi:hypothetical protein